MPKANKKSVLIWMAVICAAPIIASYWLFYYGPKLNQINYGEQLTPQSLSTVVLPKQNNESFAVGELKGKWTLLTVDSGQCDAHCNEKLYKMRQIRLMQGKEMDRINLIWLIDDATSPALKTLQEYSAIKTVMINPSTRLADTFPAQQDLHDHIYIIDPLGNLMMRYPKYADGRKISKDISRLLKVSKIG